MGGTIQILLYVFKPFPLIFWSESRVTLPPLPDLILPPDTRPLLRGPSLLEPLKYMHFTLSYARDEAVLDQAVPPAGSAARRHSVARSSCWGKARVVRAR